MCYMRKGVRGGDVGRSQECGRGEGNGCRLGLLILKLWMEADQVSQ